jgi:hypothetical protein
MPAPLLLFAVPTIGALADLAPKAAAKVIERGGILKGATNPPSLESMDRANNLLNLMKKNAQAMKLYDLRQ